jgi:D-glycero-beta-D-manno-heptose 1-phosphate adenylyltransferase
MTTTQIQSKIYNSIEDFKFTLGRWKYFNDEIVFTNGCFDVLHYGHVQYLSTASTLGTKLVLGLNSDRSVKALKGESRPINGQYERAFLLASMMMIDAVVIFNEDTPAEILSIIQPNVLVKGGDYKIDDIVGSKEVLSAGGKVEIIPFEEGFSSTKVIEKLKND